LGEVVMKGRAVPGRKKTKPLVPTGNGGKDDLRPDFWFNPALKTGWPGGSLAHLAGFLPEMSEF
jgi:hypothetical protein